MPALIDALRDPNTETRLAAMALLTHLGPLAKDAAPILRELATHDADPTVRDQAKELLKLIDAK